ncbi:transposase [Methylococcus sp. EFPC2]|uniref:REP-associated tyrosine transposase n=1 Tax=Methylococcus sp. EFPC2 TaxID=2812648 RepID=UPI0019671B11|nr:transposase [Methylococcus sp. EFPC2]QSA96182.1 transposase [Methylococcus sp. EFPC2]
MTDYRRFYIPGSTWFYTVNLAERRDNNLLVERIDLLREAFRYVKRRRPFTMEAIIVMPDHLHCIWTLPPGDADYSTRWSLIKSRFSRALPAGERVSASRAKRRERGVWQRRFWAHLLISQDDFNAHFDYIHWNPVKHGYVQKVAEWPYSSFHRFVALGIYPINWGHSGRFGIRPTEYPE